MHLLSRAPNQPIQTLLTYLSMAVFFLDVQVTKALGP